MTDSHGLKPVHTNKWLRAEKPEAVNTFTA